MNATLGELVKFALDNKRGKAFLEYTENDIAHLIMKSSEEGILHYARDEDETICGMVLASKDDENKIIFIDAILTTKKWAFKAMVKLFKVQFAGYSLKGERWHGQNKDKPHIVTYNVPKLINLTLKGE